MNSTRQLTNLSGNQSVQICSNESSQVDLITRYMRDGLLNGEAVIVIAKQALRQILKSKMGAFSFNGLNLQDLQDKDQIRFFDAEFLLLSIMSDGVLEEKAFQEYIAAPIYRAQLNYRKVRVFNGMIDILWKQDQHDMAIQLEGFWNDLFPAQEFSLLSTYSLDKLDPNTYDEALERICKNHSHLIPMEDQDLVEHGMGGAMLNVFGAAWNRVINKLADSRRLPTSIQSSATPT